MKLPLRLAANVVRPGFLKGLAASLILAVSGFLAAAAPAAATVPTPKVSLPPAGTHGFPFFSSSLDLASFGYTEQEFLISGRAQAFVNSGTLGNDGVWNVSPGATTPYTTRILVRMPTNPGSFNGTVVVEWLNVSGGIDASPDWAFEHVELLRRGYAWVGVSAQYVGATYLPTWDSVRYASISHPGDSWSYDIFSQAGMAILHGNPKPLGSLTPLVHAVLAVGESQSAFRLFTYYNAIQPVAGVYQGFLIHSTGIGAPLSQSAPGGVALMKVHAAVPATPDIPVPPTAFIRDDLHQPVLFLNTETDVNFFAGVSVHNQPDSNTFRMWEVAGTSHADAYLIAQSAQDAAKSGLTGSLQCGSPPDNNGPHVFAARAAIRALAQWTLQPAQTPAIGPRFFLQNGQVERNPVTGNAVGGIRYPQIAVPIETLTGVRPPSALAANGNCILVGGTDPWDGSTDPWDNQAWFKPPSGYDPSPTPEPSLLERYGTKDTYVSEYTQAAGQSVAQGFLLSDDLSEVVGLANAASVPNGNAGNATIIPNP